MKMALRRHGSALGQAAGRLARKPLNALLAALVIAITLTLPALGYVLLDKFSEIVRNVSGKPEISVFLKMDVTGSQAHVVEAALRKDVRISAIRFVPRDEALKQLSSRGGFSDVAGILAENPLPDAFIVEPKDDTPQRFEELRSSLAALPEVAYVQLDSEWVDRLHAMVRFGHWTIMLVASLLGGALVIVTFNTIRLQILTLRHEISVSLLLGATRSFVRRPFLYFGLLQGLLGGLLAWLMLLLLMQFIGPRLQEFARSYSIVIDVAGPKFLHGLILAASASLLGWAGAALSVRRHLKDGAVD